MIKKLVFCGFINGNENENKIFLPSPGSPISNTWQSGLKCSLVDGECSAK
jgi:hypothetical protein